MNKNLFARMKMQNLFPLRFVIQITLPMKSEPDDNEETKFCVNLKKSGFYK